MLGYLFSEVGNANLQQLPNPVIGESDVLIKVKACGICGTDIHILKVSPVPLPGGLGSRVFR